MFGGNGLKMALRYSVKWTVLANSNIDLLITNQLVLSRLRKFGMIGSKTTSRDQTFACIYARLLCSNRSNHAPWVCGSLLNPSSCISNLKSSTILLSHG